MNGRRNRDFGALTEAELRSRKTEHRKVQVAGLMPAPAPKRMADLLDTIQQVEEAARGERSFLHRR